MKIFASYAGLYTEIKKKMYQSYANYHLKFLESYDKNNITFWGISTGNEPSVGYVIIPIPSTAFTPWELVNNSLVFLNCLQIVYKYPLRATRPFLVFKV